MLRQLGGRNPEFGVNHVHWRPFILCLFVHCPVFLFVIMMGEIFRKLGQ